MKVEIKDFTPQLLALKGAQLNAVLRMAQEEMMAIARPITPLKKGDLRGRISRRITPRSAELEWEMEYAAFQEAGGDGKRVVRKYTTPGTGKGFVSRSSKEVNRRIPGIIKSLMGSK